ncbi:Receptor protein-tyrosine kinase [Aphelenchoides bicaudatus]|nr:Receptor protein-tyrosine kinase [Aphelenchoides bicaudatus]
MHCNPRYPLILGLLILSLTVHAQFGSEIDGVSHKGEATRQWMLNNKEVCLGTDNGLNILTVGQNMSHYERLLNSFVHCTRIIGNLEITHIKSEDLENDYDLVRVPGGGMQRRKRTPFWFLRDLEEITGYLVIFNVQLERIDFPKLKIIWGSKLYQGNALEINTCSLHVLNFPSLRSIESGNVKISMSPNLCFMQQNVDFFELLGINYKSRLRISGQTMCRQTTQCHQRCQDKSCFGPLASDCQVVYRRNCAKCSSGMCYADEHGNTHCCDDACTAGCFGDGEDKCMACKHYEEDGRCVTSCRGNSEYNSTAMIRRPIKEQQKRYYYGKLCVPSCPASMLIEEDRFCVARCSPGFYRNHLEDERRCVPCNGECPKVCEMTGRVDAITIKKLTNCTEIDGNIELLNHVFSTHMSDNMDVTSDISWVPALTAKDLEVLRTVKVVTGYVVVDGGNNNQLAGRPRSMDFLENLEIIEARNLYFDKYSLYVVGNYHMSSLGLKSLRKIRDGVVGFRQNRNLCYGFGIPFDGKYGVIGNWSENMNERECEQMGRVCDNTCHPGMGCWGNGPAQCLLCRHFEKDGICAPNCPVHDGYYIPPNQPVINEHNISAAKNRRCEACSEECQECWGPAADQCRKCRNFMFWSEDKKTMRCVRNCPRGTFPLGNECFRCQPACLQYQSEKMGCTGNGTNFGPGGCNSCLYAVERRKDQIECLMGSSDETVCAENNLNNYHAGFATIGERSKLKFMCHKCPAECSSCHKSSTDPRFCTCAAYTLQPNSLVKLLNTSSIELVRKGSQLNSTEHESKSIELANEYDDEFESYGEKCVLECGKGTFEVSSKTLNSSGVCERCHPLCDSEFTCTGPAATQCARCQVGGLERDNGDVECIKKCPDDRPFSFEGGVCSDENIEAWMARRRNIFIFTGIVIFILVAFLIFYLIYRCMNYRKKYEKEAKMHLPEIPALDPLRLTHRPNMRRLNLISVDELDHTGLKQSRILGQGAFGIVYAGKWKPPGRNSSIPVAIKAINPNETKNVTEAEMMKEAGLMASVEHEHLLPLVGVCVAKGGLKIVTILRPLGSLLKFLGEHKQHLGAKQMILYCYQISSAMEFLARKKIIHRDLAARNVLVRNINHVEVTDFGLAQMLQGNDSMVVMEGRVAVKWLAIESLLDQVCSFDSFILIGLTFRFTPERTDVWAFGVTCWEILTFGEAPYKELVSHLPKDHNFARELANMLEKGHRLRQPNNCSQELYQELLNCWLIEPESRPTFRKLKFRFETFCRAPHIYVQDRQAAQQMDSISDSEQRAMIEKLLQDSDFVDPFQLDPTDYNNTLTNGSLPPGRINAIRQSNTTVETFLPDTPTTATFSGNPLGRSQFNSKSSSANYKNQPLIEALGMDDDNYLMPRITPAKDDEQGLVYTPVLATDEDGKPQRESPTHEYCNDPKHKLLDADKETQSQNYVNQQVETAF